MRHLVEPLKRRIGAGGLQLLGVDGRELRVVPRLHDQHRTTKRFQFINRVELHPGPVGRLKTGGELRFQLNALWVYRLARPQRIEQAEQLPAHVGGAVGWHQLIL